MPLYLFLVVIISLSCGSLPPLESGLLRSALATTGMVLGWSLLCHLGARQLATQVKANQLDSLLAMKWLERHLELFRWLGLGVVVLCLAGFGLARQVETLPWISASLLLQALVLLTPGLTITAATWSAENYFAHLLGWTDRGVRGHVDSLWQTFRSGAAWLLAPVLILLSIADVVFLLPVSTEVAGGITVAVVLVVLTVGVPSLVRRLFHTSAIEPEVEDWVHRLLQAAGARGTRAVRWETGGRACNALVAGFVPPMRTLLVSDRLLEDLPRSQLAMVVLHEAAHLRRRHVPLRMVTILPAWAAGAVVTEIAGNQPWAMPLGSAVGIVLTLGILRLVAYRTEFDADRWACQMAAELAGSVEGVPETRQRASEALGAALLYVTADHPASRKATWLHPGLADRLRCLRQDAVPDGDTAPAATAANPA